MDKKSLTFNDTHFKAITYLSKKHNLPKGKIKSIMNTFFGRFGIKKFIKMYEVINISGFGKIYFHKSTIKKINRIQRETDEYNNRTKQKLYDRKKRKALKSKHS